MIIDDYIDYCKTYQAKYGDNCVVLIQVGDFFEQYRTDSEGADIHKICDICNIQVSRKNKNILEISRSNPLMCGFPLGALPKYVQLLLQKDYTIVLVKQLTTQPDVKRGVTEILSPSTSMMPAGGDGNYLMVLYFDGPLMGAGIVDLTTGRSAAYEASGGRDAAFACDEAVRLVNVYNPSELVLMGTLDGGAREILRGRRFLERPAEVWSISYQNAVLERVFGRTAGMLSALEAIDLERRPTASAAYCQMLQFVHEHNEQILFKLQRPEILDEGGRLMLHYNAANQLNLVGGERPLLTIVNKCRTAFGGRLFKERLLQPLNEMGREELEDRYNKVSAMADGGRYVGVLKELSGIMDLERATRRIALGTFPPADWPAFHSSLEAAGRLNVDVAGVQAAYTDVLDLDEAAKHLLTDIKGSFFKRGLYADIDKLVDDGLRGLAEFKRVAAMVSPKGECRLDCNEREGYYLTMTKKRFAACVVEDIAPLRLVTRPISTNSTILKITNESLNIVSDKIIAGQRRIGAIVSEKYRAFMRAFSDQWSDPLAAIIAELAAMDVAAACAQVSVEFKYCRPTFGTSVSAYINAKNMRHPIIERLHQKVPYKANDIALGMGLGSNAKAGLLLYGINASGKSSLMKAIGLNIILAQAGMFVPCDSFEFHPYQHLFTRISEGDNIYRGQSSFTVEMTELRNILARADKNSLVLGDELCAGTEAVSAISIVAAGINMLSQVGACYVLATHLHELQTIRVVAAAAATTLRICHMHVEIDADNRIVYDRQLRDGSGSPLYGLEVCRALLLPEAFLKVANAVRQEVQNIPKKLVSPQRSRYNADVFVSWCGLCGGSATETHHIKQQKDADASGFIGHTHKDALNNLVVLCEACHVKQHTGSEKIEGYVATSEGVQLISKKVIIASSETNMDMDMDKLRKHLCYGIGGWKMRVSGKGRWFARNPSGLLKIQQVMGTGPLQLDDLKEALFDSAG